MSNTSIKLKKSSVSGKIPLVSDIDYGELAINYADGKIYYKHSDTSIRSFLDSGQILFLIDSDYLKSIINGTYLIENRPINLLEDSNPALANNLNLNGHNITDSGTSGSITMSGDITGGTIRSAGNLISNSSSGQEGGEINLATSVTNNTLAGGYVNIDIYDNKLRIFEAGSPNRGAFIDLSQAVDGVGSNLLTGGGVGDLFDSAAANSVLDSATANGTGLTYSNGTISIANTGVVAGTYGSASLVPVFTINAQGQIDSAGTVSVAGVSNTSWDSTNGYLIINTADGGSYYTTITLDPYTTSDLNEGTNLYYTTARADSDARNAISASTGISYNPSTGVITSNDGQIVHDNLSGFVANEHIDHSTVTLTAGVGLTGGGDLTTSRTFNIDSAELYAYFNHDAFSGFVANEHVDHSGVSITAGSGLTGGGDITTSRTLNIGQGTGITVSADAIATNDSQIVHDNLSGFVANEHVDHSTVTLTAGVGLSGGGTIAASRTFNIDSAELYANFSHDAFKDFVANEHIDHSTVTLTAGVGLNGGGTIASSRTFNIDSAELYANFSHDAFKDFVANEHIDHTSVSITAGSGLTGGGDISTSRTINIGQGTGITVSADAIATNDAQIVHDNLSGFVANEHIDHSTVTLTAGVGLNGGGTIAASRTFNIDSAELYANFSHDAFKDFVSNEHIDHSLVSILAGNGLKGGGTIAASRTLSIDSAQIKGLFSSGTGVTYNSGTGSISIGQAVGTGDTPTFNGLSANSAKITSLATPTVATDAANKSYVDTLVSAALHYHDPVRVESPINLNATYNNGASGVGATLTNAGTQVALVIDGVNVDSDDRVLVYEQTTQTQNGVYVVTHKGSPTSNWVLTRSSDTDSAGFSSPNALGKGDAFYVKEGVTGAGELYVMNTEGAIIFGTTNITFSQISSAQIYKAGNGLKLTGTTFSIDSASPVPLATKLANARTIAISGDITGTATSFDGSASITITSVITAGSIVDADINASAGIVDTKLATISTAGKVSNSATTATNANTASAIVARDASGNFSAGTITAALTGNVSGNATTATTLANTRTLWGQNFNGSANVTGNLTSVGNITGTAGITVTATAAELRLVSTNNIVTIYTNGGERLRADANGDITYTGQLISSITTGSPPLAVSSTTRVANLNVATAGTADTLTTTRTLWGQNFNGSANVTGALTGVTTLSMNNQLTNTVTTGTAPFVISSTTRVSNLNVATAGTADTLTTSRTIGGVSFNGSANIDLPGVNTTGNQNTSGTAAGITGYSGTYWTSNNDGAASGLDADLLDGQQGSYYRINVYDASGALLN